MDGELYLECPKGVTCEILWNVLNVLSEKKEKLEQQLQKLCKHLVKDEFYYFIGCCMCMEVLGIQEIKINTLGEGVDSLLKKGESEAIRTELQKGNLQVNFIEGKGELLTLLSATFLSAYGKSEKLKGEYAIVKSACYGEEQPVCGVILRRKIEIGIDDEKKDKVCVIETNVDDCSGEQLGYAMECLMKAGALDASCFPLYMKKNRPAYMLQVICRKEMQEKLEDIIFQETTSIGLRRYEEERRILSRSWKDVILGDGHKIKVKVCKHHGKEYYYPEYESVKQVAIDTKRSYRNIYDEAASRAGGVLDEII